jgi:hypothetical protein
MQGANHSRKVGHKASYPWVGLILKIFAAIVKKRIAFFREKHIEILDTSLSAVKG